MKTQAKNILSHKISIAPMLDLTDRHFLYFLRQITHHAVFYTEMTAAPAILLGQRDKILSFNPEQQPLILQVGGSDPLLMGQCASYANDFGYVGVNINAGCPSSRVQSGKFGAILMKTPELVADCVDKMRQMGGLPVSVKTRLSLVEMGGDSFQHLFNFASLVQKAGCAHLIVHARQAKLNLSPKENRGTRLPLDYNQVYQLKKSFPDMIISINGNINSLDIAKEHLRHTDGAMIGRWAYANPYALSTIDSQFYTDSHPILSRKAILENMLPYLHKNKAHLSLIMPHLMGLFHSEPNAKAYKQSLMTRDLSIITDFIKSL